MKHQLKYPLARKFVNSPHLDLFAVVLILGITIWRGFHGTMYQNGEIIFNVPNDQIISSIRGGAFPLGFVSILSAMFSVMSTRLIGKQSNWGNLIGIFTTIISGGLDYLFGNGSAVITYPLTFIIYNFATFNWAKGEKIRKIDARYYVINILGIVIAYGMVYLGAYIFGGRTDAAFLNIIAITFGLSIGANVSSSLKYQETWLSWMIYNVVQLVKSLIQFNYANTAKYIFYMINASLTLVDWKWNGDQNIKVQAA